MAKDSRFIAELRNEAKRRGLEFRVEEWRGKGSHAMVWVGKDKGDDGAVDPKTARKIKKALGLD